MKNSKDKALFFVDFNKTVDDVRMGIMIKHYGTYTRYTPTAGSSTTSLILDNLKQVYIVWR